MYPSNLGENQGENAEISLDHLERYLEIYPFINRYNFELETDGAVLSAVHAFFEDEKKLFSSEDLILQKYPNIARWRAYVIKKVQRHRKSKDSWSASDSNNHTTFELEQVATAISSFIKRQEESSNKVQNSLPNSSPICSPQASDSESEVSPVNEKLTNQGNQGFVNKSSAPKVVSEYVSAAAKVVNHIEVPYEVKRQIKESDKKLVTDFEKSKLLNNLSKNWDKFYKTNTSNFFKDRHYLKKEYGPYIEELHSFLQNKCRDEGTSENINTSIKNAPSQHNSQDIVFLELGCGVGNSALPLLAEYSYLKYVATDFSEVAIRFLDEKLDIIEDFCSEKTFVEKRRMKVLENSKINRSLIDFQRSESASAEQEISTNIENTNENKVIPKKSKDQLESEALDDFLSNEDLLIPYAKNRCNTLVVDASDLERSKIKLNYFRNRCDFILILYCMSAMGPEGHENVAKLAAELCRKHARTVGSSKNDGGAKKLKNKETQVIYPKLFFRDYGKHDWAEMRFCAEKHKKCKLSDNLYTRYDGTLSYFFTKEELENRVFTKELGFRPIENDYIFREISNRAEAKTMQRIWLQGVFEFVGTGTTT